MRHRVDKKKLNRTTSHRKALLRNLSTSLVEHSHVETTLAKAKFVRAYVEKLITLAKKETTSTTVKAAKAKLYTDSAVRRLFSELGPTYKNRIGGYTRIVKLGFRAGDRAPMARIELVKEEETPAEKADTSGAKPKAKTKKAVVTKDKTTSKRTTKVKKEEVKTLDEQEEDEDE